MKRAAAALLYVMLIGAAAGCGSGYEWEEELQRKRLQKDYKMKSEEIRG